MMSFPLCICAAGPVWVGLCWTINLLIETSVLQTAALTLKACAGTPLSEYSASPTIHHFTLKTLQTKEKEKVSMEEAGQMSMTIDLQPQVM